VAYYSYDVARFRLEQGDLVAGLAYAERAVSLLQTMAAGDDHASGLMRFNVGRAQLALRRPVAALQTLLAARELALRARGPSSPLVIDLSSHVALAWGQQGRFDEAAREVDAGLPLWRQAKGLPGFRGLHHAGIVRRLARDWPAAQSLQQAALAALDDKPQNALRRSAAITELALSAVEQGDASAALKRLQADATADTSPPATPAAADRHMAIGRAQMSLGHLDQAEGSLKAADAYWQSADPRARWAGEAAYWLGRCHAAQGRHAAAQQALGRAQRILALSPFVADRMLLARGPRG
jgi:eukaryotic-like serine/threonine-protein kinase